MWKEVRSFLIDSTPVSIGWVDDATHDLVMSRFADRASTDSLSGSPLFGLATAPVGLRRRRIAMVLHGGLVRHRARSLADAADFLARLLSSAGEEAGVGRVPLPLRVFINGRSAVLVAADCDEFIDEIRLERRKVTQLPALWADVDPVRGMVRDRANERRVVGVVAGARFGLGVDRLNNLALLAGDHQADWAYLLDRLGDRVVSADRLDVAIARLLAS